MQTNRLTWSHGGGAALTLFGLCFATPGLLVIVGPYLGIPFESNSGRPPSLPFRLAFGGVFAAIGGALALGRVGVIIDRGRDELTQWWGLLGLPLRRKTRALGDFGLVSLAREVRTSSSSNGGRSSYTVYPVRLRAERGEDATLQEPRDRMRARRRAEQVAKFLGLGMADSTRGPERVRAAGTLDMCLRDQLEAEPPPVPTQPPLGQATYTTEGRTAVIESAGPDFLAAGGLLGLIGLIPALMFGGFVAMMMLPNAEPPFTYFLLGFVTLPALLTCSPLLLAWRRSTTRERIEISPDAIEVKRSGPLTRGTSRIPFEQLEEVEASALAGRHGLGAARALVKQSGVMLQTDEELVSVGAGLDPQAQAWLGDLIRYIAVHGRPPEPARV